MTPDQKLDIRKRCRAGGSLKSIASDYNVSLGTISRIASGTVEGIRHKQHHIV
ncbi:hypothetical protein ACFFGF_07615 [Asaia lannensis]|uniref:hypothetical protein n=1 Tax=Asaia lannensis TaxID=415421 RepID=UPI00338F1496